MSEQHHLIQLQIVFYFQSECWLLDDPNRTGSTGSVRVTEQGTGTEGAQSGSVIVHVFKLTTKKTMVI